MTDIVEQLRDLQSGAQWVCGETAATLEYAADEIERLRAEAARLREALQQIDTMRASRTGQTQEEMAYHSRSIAAAALAKEPGHDR